MKLIIKSSLMIISVTILLGSCSKAKNISVSNDKVCFSIAGGEQTVTVSADGSFDIKDCPDWVKTELHDSILTFTVDKNTTGNMRECYINLVGDNVTVPIEIKQADKCTFIEVSEANVIFPKEGGAKEISIKTDGDGIAVQTTDGFNADINGDKVTINAQSNQKGKIEGQLILRCDDVKTIVNVIVQGAICGRCNGTGKITCPKCGGKGGFDSGGSEESYYGCNKCGGYGMYWDGPCGDGWPGLGHIICPDCGGSGH